MSKITDTATAMLRILTANGGQPVLANEMHAALVQEVGTAKYIHDAAAHLRQRGVLIVSEKARHLSTWRLIDTSDPDIEVIEKWTERVDREALAEMVHEAQALAPGSGVTVLRRARDRVVAGAVALGAQLDIDARTIVAMCDPVTEERVGSYNEGDLLV